MRLCYNRTMASYVYVKNPNGTVYVYENESYWDSKEKKTKHKRQCIGKLDPVTKEIVPTRKPRQTDRKNGLEVATLGPLLLLDRTAVDSGISDALARAFPEDWSEILTAAYYLLSEKGPLGLIEPWSRNVGRPLRLKDLENFLDQASVTALEHCFLNDRLYSKEQDYYVFTVSAIPSLTHYLAMAKERSEQTVLTMLLLADRKTKLPLSYKVLPDYPGNIHLVKELLSPCPRCHLILGTSYYSEENLDSLFSTSTDFTLQIPPSSPLAKAAMQSKPVAWKGHRCYTCIDHDGLKAEMQAAKLEGKLRRCKEELLSGKLVETNQDFYRSFFTVKGGDVAYNEEAIAIYRKEVIGKVVLLSSCETEPGTVRDLFKRSYMLEKSFEDLLGNYDQKALSQPYTRLLPGRLFLQFLTVVLGCYIQNRLDEKGWALDEVFAELKGIKQIKHGNSKPVLTPLSERQKEILQFFDMLPEA